MAYLCMYPAGETWTFSEVVDVANCPAGGYIAAAQSTFTDLPTLTDLFTVPVAADLQQMFTLGFALPLVSYLTAWGYQTVIQWFESQAPKGD